MKYAGAILSLLAAACGGQKPAPAPAPPPASVDAGAAPVAIWDSGIEAAAPVSKPFKAELDAIAADKRFAGVTSLVVAPTRVFGSGEKVTAIEWYFNAVANGTKVGGAGLDIYRDDTRHSYWDSLLLAPAGKAKRRSIPDIATNAHIVEGADGSGGANRAAAIRFYEAFDRRRESEFMELLTDEVVWNDMLAFEAASGKADFQRFWNTAPATKHTVTVIGAYGDYVILENEVVFTKSKKTAHSAQILQFEDGKVAFGWSYADGAELK